MKALEKSKRSTMILIFVIIAIILFVGIYLFRTNHFKFTERYIPSRNLLIMYFGYYSKSNYQKPLEDAIAQLYQTYFTLTNNLQNTQLPELIEYVPTHYETELSDTSSYDTRIFAVQIPDSISTLSNPNKTPATLYYEIQQWPGKSAIECTHKRKMSYNKIKRLYYYLRENGYNFTHSEIFFPDGVAVNGSGIYKPRYVTERWTKE